jgi:hypothetical protein
LSFIIKDAAILVSDSEMWWRVMTFTGSEWNPVGGICTPHLCFSQTQLLRRRITSHQRDNDVSSSDSMSTAFDTDFPG